MIKLWILNIWSNRYTDDYYEEKRIYYANIPEIIVRGTIEDDDPPTTTSLSLCVADAFKQMEIYALVDEFQAFTG